MRGLLFGRALDGKLITYYLVFFSALALFLLMLRIVNSPFGRVLQAIRENEFRAEAIGYRVVVYRTTSSVLSALFACAAGAMLALWLRYNGPDTSLSFEIMIDILLMVVIGGLGSVHGAFLGAIFLITMPQVISLTKDYLPAAVGQAPGLQAVVYGVVLVAFVLFEPLGLYGRWLKVRAWFQLFPFYRQGMFKRQKSFQKSDRLK